MSADLQDPDATQDDEVLRFRLRVYPGEVLYRPLQSCRSSSERARRLLSLAIQGYLLGPDQTRGQPVLAAGRVSGQPEPGTESYVIRGEHRDEMCTGGTKTSATVGDAPATPTLRASGGEEVLDGLSFATEFKNVDQ